MKYIYHSSGNKDAYTLLLLHGTGGDENDLLPIARYFGNDINILSIRGNVTENGMPRFFRRLAMGVFDEKDVAARTTEMVFFIRGLAEKEGFDTTKIIALAYSNGANIAGSTLLMYPGFLAGAILYRPMQPFTEFNPLEDNKHHTPVFMSNGSSDPTIRATDTNRYVELLKSLGLEVSNHTLPTGHQLTQQDIQLSVEWFNKNFAHASV